MLKEYNAKVIIFDEEDKEAIQTDYRIYRADLIIYKGEKIYYYPTIEKIIENMKPTCPNCGKEIHELKNYQSSEKYYTFNKDAKYELVELQEETNDYECPYCNKIIAKNERDAIRFLNPFQ